MHGLKFTIKITHWLHRMALLRLNEHFMVKHVFQHHEVSSSDGDGGMRGGSGGSTSVLSRHKKSPSSRLHSVWLLRVVTAVVTKDSSNILQMLLSVTRHCVLCKISLCGTFYLSHQTSCINNVWKVWHYVRQSVPHKTSPHWTFSISCQKCPV